jgi:beta-phosphoglucomutase family hydrolase
MLVTLTRRGIDPVQIVSEPFDDAHGGRETPLGFPASISVALFDLDGVLTSTAVLHQKAWKQAFDHFLRKRHGDKFVPFSERDYLQYVDGRPRRDGVRTFLRSRQFEVADDVVEEIGTDKNELVLASLKRGEVESYPGSVRYLTALRETGVRVGVVTSSENGRAVLDAANLSRFVQERIDGTDIGRLKLRGKPAPDSFLACAQAFGVDPPNAAVFEDALSGIEAGRAGGFGYVVGVDRVGGGQHAAAMREAGADVVVTDLAELLSA